jgi:hypothetical protein
MKFVKSLSLPFLSLALLLPIAIVGAEEVPTIPTKTKFTTQILSSLAYAQESVINTVKAHAYAAAALAAIGLTGYIVKRTLFSKRK